ncbi:MAG: ribose-phosphate pyrophosphokinase [Geminicoccaceae bacterium]
MVDIDKLERVLIQAACEGRSVTYQQLLAFFGRRVGPGNVRALCRDLGEVCDRSRARGEPDLACLVVRKSDGLPGEGFFAAARDQDGYRGGAEGSDASRYVDEAQTAAFRYWQKRRPLPDVV